MLEWLINNLHLIEVNIDAGYCDEQQKPSACFRSLEYKRGGRPWSMNGEQRERLIAAIHREMNHVHKWEPITRYPGGWQDVCVDCGAHRDVPDALRLPIRMNSWPMPSSWPAHPSCWRRHGMRNGAWMR